MKAVGGKHESRHRYVGVELKSFAAPVQGHELVQRDRSGLMLSAGHCPGVLAS